MKTRASARREPAEVIYSCDNDSCALRVYGRDGVAAAVGQHGAFDVGVVHLHHEGARDAGALLQPQARLRALVLLFETPDISPSKGSQRERKCPRATSFPPLTPAVGQFLMWWPVFPQR